MSKREVLACFKRLHKARKLVFNGDHRALFAGREKINEEFRRYKHVTDTADINDLIKMGSDAEDYLRTMVVQAKWDSDREIYEVKLTKDTHLPENKDYIGF